MNGVSMSHGGVISKKIKSCQEITRVLHFSVKIGLGSAIGALATLIPVAICVLCKRARRRRSQRRAARQWIEMRASRPIYRMDHRRLPTPEPQGIEDEEHEEE